MHVAGPRSVGRVLPGACFANIPAGWSFRGANSRRLGGVGRPAGPDRMPRPGLDMQAEASLWPDADRGTLPFGELIGNWQMAAGGARHAAPSNAVSARAGSRAA